MCCSAGDRDHSVRGMPSGLRPSEAPSPATSQAVVGVIWTLVEAPARLQEAPVTLEAAGTARRGTGGWSGARPSKTVSSMRSRLPRVLVPQVWALCLPWHAGQGAVEGRCETPAAGRAGATACGMPTGDAMRRNESDGRTAPRAAECSKLPEKVHTRNFHAGQGACGRPPHPCVK